MCGGYTGHVSVLKLRVFIVFFFDFLIEIVGPISRASVTVAQQPPNLLDGVQFPGPEPYFLERKEARIFCLSVSYFFLAANIIALYSGSAHKDFLLALIIALYSGSAHLALLDRERFSL